MKKLNVEKILLIFIAICPLLDIVSFLFRNQFNTSLSPSTFIRPIIPALVATIIFFKNKFKLKMIIVGLIYGVYALIHLVVFQKLKTGSSYGVITHEMQYLVNYTYMILNLFIYLFIFNKKTADEKIKKYTLISMCIYIGSIILSVITKTYSTTYLEGIGIKGWFESGNSISSILILGLFILFPLIKNKKYNKIVIPTILLIGIYLMTMIGTRVGLFGFILVSIFYAFAEIAMALKNKIKFNKKVIILSICIGIILISFIFIKGSSTLQRRKFLQDISNEVIDETTGQASHITGDLLAIKNKIDAGEITEDYMAIPSQQALKSLYDFANKYEISNSNKRVQQIVYNTYQVIYQKNIIAILFGNGFLTNVREMILEMEIPAFLYNFGLIGLTLYFIPFLFIFLYCAYKGIKNIKKIDVDYLMLLGGSGFSYILSFFAGYTFFNSSTMMVIIVVHVLLINKVKSIKEETIDKEEVKILETV